MSWYDWQKSFKWTTKTTNRHSAILLSLCGCQPDNADGICDKQWCRISMKVLTIEMLVTFYKFAKWLIKLMVAMMSFWLVQCMSFSCESLQIGTSQYIAVLWMCLNAVLPMTFQYKLDCGCSSCYLLAFLLCPKLYLPGPFTLIFSNPLPIF